jgi:flagellar biosynthesis chaperone FliJ
MKLHQETLDGIPPPSTKDKDLKKNTTQKACWKQLQENRKVLKECANQLSKSVKALKPLADSSGDVGVVHADLQSYKSFVDKLEEHGDAFEERANALNTKAEEVLNSVSSLQDSSNTFAQLQESSMDASEKAQLSTTKTLDDMGSTISDIQRSLDSLVKIANKNKYSFWATKGNPDPDQSTCQATFWSPTPRPQQRPPLRQESCNGRQGRSPQL